MKKFLYAGVTKWLAGLLLLLSLGAGIYFGVWVMSAVSSGGMEVLSETVPADYFDSKVCLDSLVHAVQGDMANEFTKQVYEEYLGFPMAEAMTIAYFDEKGMASGTVLEGNGDNGDDVVEADAAQWGIPTGISRRYTYSRLAEMVSDTAVGTVENDNVQLMFQNEGVEKANAYVQVAQKKLIEVIKHYGRRVSVDEEYFEDGGHLFEMEELSEYMSDSDDGFAEQNDVTEIVDGSAAASTSVVTELPPYYVYVAEAGGSRWEYFDGTGQVRCSRFGELDTGKNWLFYNKEDLIHWMEAYGDSSGSGIERAFLAVPVCYFDTLVTHYITNYNTYMSYCQAVEQSRSGQVNYRYEVVLDNGKNSWSNLRTKEDMTQDNAMVWSCELNSGQTDSSLTEENAQYLYDRLLANAFYADVETYGGISYQLMDYFTEHKAKITISIRDNKEYNDFLAYGLEEFEKNRPLYLHARKYLFYSISLLVLALVLFVYLCMVVGYGDNENTLTEMPMSLRVPTELTLGVPAALLLIEVLIADSVSGSQEVLALFGTRENFLIFMLVLMCGSVLLFWFELLTRIRHKMFLKKSWCVRLLRLFVRGVSRLYKAAAQSFGERYRKMKASGSNLVNAFRIDHRLSAAFLCSQAALFILVLIGGSGFYHGRGPGILALLLAFVIEAVVLNRVFRDIRYTAEIIDGVAQLEEGNLDYKIDTEHMRGHKKALAESINHLQNGLKLAVEQSLKDERLKTELITNVSHDIKTPLTSIINYVDLLKKEPMAGENAEHYLEVLDQKSQRLKQLMEDLVEVSKSSTGNVEFVPMRLDLLELLRQTLGEFEDKFKSRNLTVIENFKMDCAVVNLDSRHTFRVFENLCQNIYKYAMENSRIYVDVSEETATVSVVMKNISQYELNISAEELMERFVRGDESRNTSGSGLGLSIARNLVTLQQGTFDITLDGDLFKVTVTFPLADTVDGLAEPNEENK